MKPLLMFMTVCFSFACGSDVVPPSVTSAENYPDAEHDAADAGTDDGLELDEPQEIEIVGDPLSPIDPQVEACRDEANPDVVCRPKNSLSITAITSYRRDTEERYLSIQQSNWDAASREKLATAPFEAEELAGCAVERVTSEGEDVGWLAPLDAGEITTSTERGTYFWTLQEDETTGRVNYQALQEPDFSPSDMVQVETAGGPDLSSLTIAFPVSRLQRIEAEFIDGQVVANWDAFEGEVVFSMSWYASDMADDWVLGFARCEVNGADGRYTMPSEILALAQPGDAWSMSAHVVSHSRLVEFEDTRIHTAAATFTSFFSLQLKQ